MRAIANLVAFVATLVIATVFIGWWAVPIASFVWTLVAPRRAAVLYAACAGAMAWGALLLWSARSGDIASLDRLLGAVMRIPAHGLTALTLAYAALLAGAAALLAQAIRPPARRVQATAASSRSTSD